jgi:hypothetical protein
MCRLPELTAATGIPLRFCAWTGDTLGRHGGESQAAAMIVLVIWRGFADASAVCWLSDPGQRLPHDVPVVASHRESKRLAIALPWSQVTSDCRQL